MSYTTNNTANQQQATVKDNRKWVYGSLVAILLITWAYMFYDRSKTTQTVQQLQTQVAAIDNNRDALQQSFDAASAKLDSLTGSNIRLQGTLAEKNQEVQKLKANIANILRNKNATTAELVQAKKMIEELNAKTEALFEEVEKLRAENQQLTVNNQQLATEKTMLTNDKNVLQTELQKTNAEKEAVTNLASTLKAANINITPINIKSGGKEKATTVAKRVDVMRVSFDLEENRVASTGKKDLYIRVVAPDGNTLTMGDVIDTKDAGAIQYTSKVTVDYEQGKRSAISFDWKPENEATYQTGNYKIEIYQNGYKIGEGTKSLKKSGLFS